MHRYLRTLVVAPFVLAGCAEKEAEWAQRGKESLIGLDQSSIRMCAGLPTGTTKDGRGEIWMYEHTTSPPGGVAPPTFTVPPGFNVGGSAPSGYCRVQLRFASGKVAEVQYAGATDILDARDAACGQIVRTCLDYKPGKQADAR
ncbi:hypothetical protein [Bradyrhizobium sp. ARR65]|uniref:hypothetical protein n=1 Tax=Bradyrhizobium sp. ARR65 TaxID=1040989 RepID=UPI00046490FF|nr:hypothetical protein [Bradyrhizobium sp. ARR65]